ncbi:MAG: hypothetical protein K2Q20_15685 [Phycisphaerales bacterium]|nr:hypothetical protein [Phycisphaerales bacterium]
MAIAARAVVVSRRTDYQMLLARHATRGQAEFFLRSRGRDIDAVQDEHERVQRVLGHVLAHLPPRWRRASVDRADLSRFLFEPEDVVIAVGQDGLVANVAKYLTGQRVLGVNPLRDRFDGVLVRLLPDRVKDVLERCSGGGKLEIEPRTMVRASLDDGQSLLALNEVFIGHRSHQSARYRIAWREHAERHSSSGVIVATGTGATGWARSIAQARGDDITLPAPTDPALAFLVREAFPSVATGTALTAGTCGRDDPVALTSEMQQGGVAFGDGIEEDFLAFDWGQTVRVEVAPTVLNLVVG